MREDASPASLLAQCDGGGQVARPADAGPARGAGTGRGTAGRTDMLYADSGGRRTAPLTEA
jgi:hypothetical protein